jgi:hypothetical protein
MGYEFHCPGVRIVEGKGGKVEVELEVTNRGVAPFYHDWKTEWALLSDGRPVKTFPCSGKVTGLLPGDRARVWADALEVRGVKPGRYVLAVRVVNPLPGGKPLRFANQTQDADAAGWLSLRPIRIP